MDQRIIIVRILLPLLGGGLIGLAASVLLLTTGRVFGVSGILAGAVLPNTLDRPWRVAAVAGLISAGILLRFVYPEVLVNAANGSLGRYVIAGLLVGYGTQLGSGCTSGHGVCGLSRLSWRSIVATLVFIAAGILTVTTMDWLGLL